MSTNNETRPCAEICADSPKHSLPFVRVFDGRKQPIKNLWRRGERFYARITVLLASGAKAERRIALKASTVTDAKVELAALILQRGNNSLQLSQSQCAPLLSEYVETYVAAHRHLKRQTTQSVEREHLKHHCVYFEGVRLDRVTRSSVLAYRAKKLAEAKWAGSTANLSLTVLRNVFRHAIDSGLLVASPVDGIRPVRYVAKKRSLVTPAMFETLCATAVEHLSNGQLLSDYVKLMCLCGARRSEALRLKWSDVDFVQRQLTVGSDGQSKNHLARHVDFSEPLAEHLQGMSSRRVSSEFLFPALRGAGRPLKTLVESLKLARAKAELNICFHDCRHHFISFCIMSGIDFMTIARWVGHSDGGVLIGKVYGHLSDTHAKAQAKKVTFAAA